MCHQVSKVASNGRQVNTWHDRKSVQNSTDDSSGACSNPRTQILTFLTFWQCKHRSSPLLKEHIPSDWDLQVLELQLAAPPLSNLFLHTSASSMTSWAIYLQTSLLIAETTWGLLKTTQVCGTCWAALCRKKVWSMINLWDCCEFIMNRDVLTSWLRFCLCFRQVEEQKTADICVLVIWSPSINRATFVESTTVDNKFPSRTPVAQWGNMLRVLYWDKNVVLLVTEPGAKCE